VVLISTAPFRCFNEVSAMRCALSWGFLCTNFQHQFPQSAFRRWFSKSGDHVEAKMTNPFKVGNIIKVPGKTPPVALGAPRSHHQRRRAGLASTSTCTPATRLGIWQKSTPRPGRRTKSTRTSCWPSGAPFRQFSSWRHCSGSGRALWNKHDTTKPRKRNSDSAVESTVHRYP